MKIDEAKREDVLLMISRWAHDSGADAVSALEGKISAVVRFPSGRRMLVTAVPCDCGQMCDGWKIRSDGTFDAEPGGDEAETRF